jgi:hypothetical protein
MHCEPASPPNHVPATSDPDRPVYKVIFWSRPEEHLGWRAEEWAVYDADGADEVLAWATHEARPDQTYTVHVAGVARPGKNTDLLWLYGLDPTIPT